MKCSLLAFLFSVVTINRALAYQVNIDFSIHSNESKIYACKVGIRRMEPYHDFNDIKKDALIVKVAPFRDMLDLGEEKEIVIHPSRTNPTKFKELGGAGHKISKVSLDLSSSRYGVEYFIEVCFDSSEYDGWDENNSSSVYKFAFSVLMSNFTSVYVEDADLSLSAHCKCKDSLGNDRYDQEVASSSANWSSLTAQKEVYLDRVMFSNCRVRYYFGENNVNKLRSLINIINGTHDSFSFTTHTSIVRQ